MLGVLLMIRESLRLHRISWFHHRLVAIHPFANGNGRHARLLADVILLSQGHKRFTWGGAENLVKPSQVRQKYIAALRSSNSQANLSF